MDTSELFELELPLPNQRLWTESNRLIGFEQRYQRLRRDLRLLADHGAVRAWSERYHGGAHAICDAIADRYPLVIFAGDVGTGKTATAMGVSDRLARESSGDAMLFKLSTRVRGAGKVGEMSALLNEAFEVIVKQAGRARQSFLIIDEADSLAASRETTQSHHEDKVAVNTIIQKVDDLRRHDGRVLALLCTNRPAALDPAVMRRAARVEMFTRPSADERQALLELDLEGLGLANSVFQKLTVLTGPKNGTPGFTFSDLRTRLLPAALARAFPDRALTPQDLLEAAAELAPSPEVQRS
jgi:AAA+ superfamily predicted ATPase